jgi:D-threo-aldose 1-dehydrogenase
VETNKRLHNLAMTILKERTQLPKSGISIPTLIFGSSALGNLYQELPRATKRDIVSDWFRCVDAPVCVDTAGKYGAGLALEELGNALRSLKIQPENVVISNKLGWKRVPLAGPEPTFEPGVWKKLSHDAVQQLSYEGILECWEQGNELLGEPYSASLLSVHDPDEYLAAGDSPKSRAERMDDLKGAYGALEELRREGRASAIGVGAKEWRIIREIVEKTKLDWVMLADSLTVHTHPVELLRFVEELNSAGIFVINSAVFNSGFLVGGGYFDYKPVSRESHPDLFRWRDQFEQVCQSFAVSPADACVEFSLAPRAVSAVAMNTSKPERVAKNAESVTKRAPAEFWEEMARQGLVSITPQEMR